jgi:hypothetical protein
MGGAGNAARIGDVINMRKTLAGSIKFRVSAGTRDFCLLQIVEPGSEVGEGSFAEIWECYSKSETYLLLSSTKNKHERSCAFAVPDAFTAYKRNTSNSAWICGNDCSVCSGTPFVAAVFHVWFCNTQAILGYHNVNDTAMQPTAFAAAYPVNTHTV